MVQWLAKILHLKPLPRNHVGTLNNLIRPHLSHSTTPATVQNSLNLATNGFVPARSYFYIPRTVCCWSYISRYSILDRLQATALKSSAFNLHFTFYRDKSEVSKKVGNNSMSCLSPTCCLTFRKSFASKQFFIIIAQATEYFNQHLSWLFIRSRG